MCSLGAIKFDRFILLKTRDPVKTMQFKDSIKRSRGKIKKLFVANKDGYYCGINQYGLAIICSVVKVDSNYSKFFIGNLIPKLLDAKNAKKSIDILKKTDKKTVGNLIIADKNNAYVAEVFNKTKKIIKAKKKIVRTNHFLKIKKGSKNKKEYKSTFLRYSRLDKLLNKVKNIEGIKDILKDHYYGKSENSICRHGSKFTNSAFILDTAVKALYYCRSNPCESDFKKYEL